MKKLYEHIFNTLSFNAKTLINDFYYNNDSNAIENIRNFCFLNNIQIEHKVQSFNPHEIFILDSNVKIRFLNLNTSKGINIIITSNLEEDPLHNINIIITSNLEEDPLHNFNLILTKDYSRQNQMFISFSYEKNSNSSYAVFARYYEKTKGDYCSLELHDAYNNFNTTVKSFLSDKDDDQIYIFSNIEIIEKILNNYHNLEPLKDIFNLTYDIDYDKDILLKHLCNSFTQIKQLKPETIRNNNKLDKT